MVYCCGAYTSFFFDTITYAESVWLAIRSLDSIPTPFAINAASKFIDILHPDIRCCHCRIVLLNDGAEKLIRKAMALHRSCKDAASSALRDLGLDNYNA
jgi:hypothetical protein